MKEKAESPTREGAVSFNFDSLQTDTDSEINSLIDGASSTRSTPHPNEQELFSTGQKKGFTSGIANFFKGAAPTVPATVPFQCSPTPTITRDFKERRKTILNTFCLTPKKKFDENVYKLYQCTISRKAEAL